MFVWRIARSPFGQVLRAIKDNRPRMISLGYPVDRFILLNFVLSAALSGVAGFAQGAVARPGDAHRRGLASTSGEVVLMVLLGGLGTLFGPVVGAALTVSMDNYLACGIGIPVPVVIGVIFIAVILIFRRGIVGEILYRLSRRGSRIGQ